MKNVKEIRQEMRNSAHNELDDFEFLVSDYGAEDDLKLDEGARVYKQAIIQVVKDSFSKVVNIPLDRLEAICEAEREGRCVISPCKMDDTLYRIVTKKTRDTIHKIDSTHSFVTTTILSRFNFFEILDNFGKTVFLTLPEAQAKLKETTSPNCDINKYLESCDDCGFCEGKKIESEGKK